MGTKGMGKNGMKRKEGEETGTTYASAIRAIALIARWAFPHDLAVGVGVLVRGDVAGAAAAVGDDGVVVVGHFVSEFAERFDCEDLIVEGNS